MRERYRDKMRDASVTLLYIEIQKIGKDREGRKRKEKNNEKKRFLCNR